MNLLNPQEACDYINAVWELGQAEWLFRVGEVAKAQGMSALARGAGINRSVLYHMLSRKGNPTYVRLFKIISALGLIAKVEALKGGEKS